MTAVWIYLIFLLTYAGMVAGRLPWLRVDRTGIALVGLIALLATSLTLDEIGARIDMPTLLLLFALMIISAQFVASGFCDAVFEWIGASAGGPIRMLALTVFCAGGLAAFLANDILVFVATPLLIDAVRARGLDPRPYLIAFIAASNAGSAATIIGAPQTIVIGQLGQLRLPTYLLACGVPAMMALLIVFVVVALAWHGSFELPPDEPQEEPPPTLAFGLHSRRQNDRRPHDRWQTNKGILALAALLALFCTDLPKDVFGLPIAALLLLNRKYSSRELIAGADWPLLVLVACLFGVTGALGSTALPGLVLDSVQHVGLLPDNLLAAGAPDAADGLHHRQHAGHHPLPPGLAGCAVRHALRVGAALLARREPAAHRQPVEPHHRRARGRARHPAACRGVRPHRHPGHTAQHGFRGAVALYHRLHAVPPLSVGVMPCRKS